MKKVGLFIATAVMLVLFAFSANAETEGYYTYKVENGEATITYVDTSISGEVTIPSKLGGYSVTSIGDYAFRDCTSLISITIPDSVTSIGSGAFKDCSSLTSITILDSVTSIGGNAFFGCSSLTSITIPDSVTSIGYQAFYNCTSLASVTIGDGVTSIGFSAFSNCTSLANVTIGDSVTSIGSYAFCYCSSLTSITIPDSVTSIGSSAFSFTKYYNDESNWKDDVLYIGNRLIEAKSSITSCDIREGTVTIASSAFEDCSSLTSITIPDSVTSIGYQAFYNCSSLTSITIPDSVTSIDEDAFYKCTSLANVTIGDSVTSIGSSAFSFTKYYNDESNWKDNILYIGNHLIKAKSSITSCDIREGTVTIASSAFEDCSSLTSITIPDSVTSICSYAFEDCSSLTSITIPDSVTSIDEDAFYKCTNLTSIIVNTGNANYSSDSSGVLFNKDKSELVCYPVGNTRDSYTIPDSVTSIGNRAFYDCANLTSITIPDSVTSIDEDAFYKCTNLTSIIVNTGNANYSSDSSGVLFNKDKSELVCYPVGNTRDSYTIPDSVTSIGDYAFFKCSSLTSITIPDSVTSIGDYAFFKCSSLTSITIPDSVTSIGHDAFYECTSLASVTIGDGVTSIGYEAFYKCTNLTSITTPDSVTSIGEDAFSNCTSLASVTIGDSVTSIGDCAFYGCSSLKYLKMPASLKIDDSYTFYDVTNLEEVVLSKGSGEMASYNDGYYSNYDYTPWYKSRENFKKLTVEDGVTSIGDAAFYGCTSLASVTIGDSVTSIGDAAFYGCTSLTSVTIDDSVTSIGECAFYNCPIKDVYYTGTRSQWKDIAIENWNGSLTNATIHHTHKNIVDIPQQNPTCTKVGYTEGMQCSNCKEWISGHEEISMLGHSYSSSYTTDKKATLSANGSKSKHCTRDGCTAKTSVTSIAKISSVTLSQTNYIYDGKNKTPKVTVKDAEGNTLVKNVDYKTSVASKRSGIGKYTVKVTFMGNYSGSKSVYFYIKTGKPATVKSASQTTSSVKLTWSAVPGAAGYTVYRYSPSKKAYVKAGTTEGTSLTVKSLYAGTKYTFRVVAYGKTSAGKVYESDSYALLKTATKTKTPILSDVTAYKGKVKLFWTATSGETGYTVYYSTKKDSGFKKYANYESNSGYVNNLTSGKTYYFKVRTYIKTNSGYVYSDWSNIKGVKVK